MSKQTKQQIIDELIFRLARAEKRRGELQNMLNEIKDAVFGKNDYQHSISDIINEVADYNNLITTGNAKRDQLVETLENENYRYWNLIRSLSGDKTLEKELEIKNEIHMAKGTNNINSSRFN